jgi:hypothetical protein
MIVVLVRDENRRKVGGLQPEPRQAPHRLGEVEPAIDEQTRRSGFDDETVAFAAAAQ